ncbi:jg2902 [Pararge aegeria aegeria]|uniref:Jg2902 protein n=1 Tax=Pararge aegeria aegeria TaxID=348720 RepID=A0A8S4SEM7_9NEOP|nr:jg2902 [Pararge aegeria aegeria]
MDRNHSQERLKIIKYSFIRVRSSTVCRPLFIAAIPVLKGINNESRFGTFVSQKSGTNQRYGNPTNVSEVRDNRFRAERPESDSVVAGPRQHSNDMPVL